jgi:hypothetical protein
VCDVRDIQHGRDARKLVLKETQAELTTDFLGSKFVIDQLYHDGRADPCLLMNSSRFKVPHLTIELHP